MLDEFNSEQLYQENYDFLSSFPPAAQEIYRILNTGEKFTFEEIKSRSKYSIRMIRYSLLLLNKAQIITKIPNLKDTRRCFYAVNGNLLLIKF